MDSGSTDDTLKILPAGSVVHKFVGREINYSEAINQGLEHITTDYVFVLSSHMLLIKRAAVEYALNLLELGEMHGAAYFIFRVTHGTGSHDRATTAHAIRIAILRRYHCDIRKQASGAPVSCLRRLRLRRPAQTQSVSRLLRVSAIHGRNNQIA